MGGLISRFRAKKTTIEVLEQIDKDIGRLQRNRKENQDRQKRIVTSLLIYSIVIYIISAIIFYLLYFPETWRLRLLYSLPLLVFPFLIWGLKKLLHWYFVKRITSNDVALRELRERKKQILEDVMETETYKKAKEILEKFDPARFRKLETEAGSTSPVGSPQGTPGTVVTHRTVRTVQHAPRTPQFTSTPRMPQSMPRPVQPTKPQPSPFPSTPVRATMGQTPRAPMSAQQQQSMTRMAPRGFVPPPGPPMPRSVLPRERGTMDRLMDYLVGDGPENRYALICQQCYSHNGMALKEEFEYLSFRCCYCYFMNPARKQRPFAPRLEFFTPNLKGYRPGAKDSQASASNEESDDDSVDDDNDSRSDRDSIKSEGSEYLSISHKDPKQEAASAKATGKSVPSVALEEKRSKANTSVKMISLGQPGRSAADSSKGPSIESESRHRVPPGTGQSKVQRGPNTANGTQANPAEMGDHTATAEEKNSNMNSCLSEVQEPQSGSDVSEEGSVTVSGPQVLKNCDPEDANVDSGEKSPVSASDANDIHSS